MALIHCPECQSEVSDKAPACLRCGYPVAASQSTPSPQKTSETGLRGETGADAVAASQLPNSSQHGAQRSGGPFFSAMRQWEFKKVITGVAISLALMIIAAIGAGVMITESPMYDDPISRVLAQGSWIVRDSNYSDYFEHGDTFNRGSVWTFCKSLPLMSRPGGPSGYMKPGTFNDKGDYEPYKGMFKGDVYKECEIDGDNLYIGELFKVISYNDRKATLRHLYQGNLDDRYITIEMIPRVRLGMVAYIVLFLCLFSFPAVALAGVTLSRRWHPSSKRGAFWQGSFCTLGCGLCIGTILGLLFLWFGESGLASTSFIRFVTPIIVYSIVGGILGVIVGSIRAYVTTPNSREMMAVGPH